MEVNEISVEETPEYPQAITPARANGGRPTKCTPEMIRKLLALIQKGIPYEPACRSLGISYRTMRRWVEKGEQPGSPEPFRQFCQDLMRATAKGETALGQQWLDLATEAKDWRGIHKYMACRWPQRWSEKRVDAPAQPVAPVRRRELNTDGMSLQQIRDIRDGLARMLGIEGTP